MSKIHIYCPIIYYIALFHTLKRNNAVNGHDMYCTCVFSHLYVSHIQERQTGGGGLGGSQPPLNFGRGGVEHLSTPPDFEKIFMRGGGAGVGSP